jgi:PAS domain S-box-containing protein
MHCFFLVVNCQSKDNQIVYVSKNVNSYLGYSQDQLINHSLFEFIHSFDHQYLRNYLQNNHQGLIFIFFNISKIDRIF